MLLRSVITVIFTLAVCNKSTNALRVLGVAPVAAPSHFIQVSKIFRELALRGHQVDVISMFPLKKPIENYTDYPFDVTPEYFEADSTTYEDTHVFAKLSMDFFAKYAGTDACDYMRQPNVQKVLQKGNNTYDVIIAETFMTYCYWALGKHFNAPLIAFVALKNLDWMIPGFGTPVNTAYIPSMFLPKTQYMNFWERLYNTLITHFVTYHTNNLLENQVAYVEKYFGRKLSSIHDLFDDVSMLFINSHSSLDVIRPLTPNVVEIAGLHIINDDQELTPDLEKWLNESINGCVYFSFGSMIKFETFPERIIKIFYEMFDRIAPTTVLMRMGDVAKLPPGLPKNVKMARWLPQIAILKHKNTKAFITHGGLASTQESIAHNVPMIGIPFFVDQYPNVEYYVKKKVAIQVNIDDSLTADFLTKAVKTVLTDPAYKSNIEALSNLYWDRPMNPLDTAIFWIEYTARNGPALKSPACKLAWWQLYLLDVYGFLLAFLILSLFISIKIAVSLWRFLSPRMHIRTRDNIKYSKVE